MRPRTVDAPETVGVDHPQTAASGVPTNTQRGSGPLVVLIGASGAGKTTVGRLVAQRLGVGFRDTDADVEREAGKTVSDVFVDDGETRFRELERDAVRRALDEHDGVLALGGGAVVDEDTRDALRGHRVVFLDVGLADAAHRCGLDAPRPLLAVNPRAELRRMLDERRPYYLAVATATVGTDGREPDDVAAGVLALVTEKATVPGGVKRAFGGEQPYPGMAARGDNPL
jgi:shikimate kinase